MSQKSVENQLLQLLVQCLELKYDVEVMYLVKLLQVLKISQVRHLAVAVELKHKYNLVSRF
jgi:hypothetical protein